MILGRARKCLLSRKFCSCQNGNDPVKPASLDVCLPACKSASLDAFNSACFDLSLEELQAGCSFSPLLLPPFPLRSAQKSISENYLAFTRSRFHP